MRSWLGHFAGLGALAYLASIAVPSGHAQQDDIIERGKAVVVGAPGIAPAQACVNCHGIDGKGDFAAGFPRLAGQSSDYLFHALQAYAAGTRNNQIMSPIAKSLSEGQMDTSNYRRFGNRHAVLKLEAVLSARQAWLWGNALCLSGIAAAFSSAFGVMQTQFAPGARRSG